MKDILYFSNPQIVLQEVPNEISLALSISGCPMACKGCHSKFTWQKNYGQELTDATLVDLITKNKHISCILFYGGEWQKNRLIELFSICKNFNKKICLYTGLDYEKVSNDLIAKLNFIKTGRYMESLGGLDKKTTNQKFYKLPEKKDITSIFLA